MEKGMKEAGRKQDLPLDKTGAVIVAKFPLLSYFYCERLRKILNVTEQLSPFYIHTSLEQHIY